jgi:ABC-type multidrug transport system fused ATPase/permease subunit
MSGSIAYVPQTPWIQSGTVRDNILFGKPMNNEEYDRAIRCCALDKDMENFPHGDLTEIGQRGLNMSGGQKQRIQLARAVYNGADVYLLDDPFSAVDAHTAATLFNVRNFSSQFQRPLSYSQDHSIYRCVTFSSVGLCHGSS